MSYRIFSGYEICGGQYENNLRIICTGLYIIILAHTNKIRDCKQFYNASKQFFILAHENISISTQVFGRAALLHV